MASLFVGHAAQKSKLHNLQYDEGGNQIAETETESITMHSVHLPFQCSKVYRLHEQKKNQDNSFKFRFQIGNERLLGNLGRIFFFIIIFFLDKNRKTGFSSKHLLRLQNTYKSFV